MTHHSQGKLILSVTVSPQPSNASEVIAGIIKIQGVEEMSCYNPLVVEEPLVLVKSSFDTVWQSAWIALV